MTTERKRKVSLFDVVVDALAAAKTHKANGGATGIGGMLPVNKWNGRPYSQRYYDILEKRKTLPDTTLSCLQHHKFNHHSKNGFLKQSSSSPSLLNSRSGISRVSCSIREKENIAENERIAPIVTGLRVADELGEKSGSGFEKLGFEKLNWPPWKNVPQRYKLIGTTSLAFVICNMDKVNLSIAIIPMSHEFGWSSSVAGLVQSSFFWGYALSQLPGGWLSKIFGGRVILQFGVLVWSLAIAIVPIVYY